MDADNDEKPEDEAKDSSRISLQARREFERDPQFQMWTMTKPITVRDLSLKKDQDKTGCCASPMDEEVGLQ